MTKRLLSRGIVDLEILGQGADKEGGTIRV